MINKHVTLGVGLAVLLLVSIAAAELPSTPLPPAFASSPTSPSTPDCTVDICHYDEFGGAELVTVPVEELGDHLMHGDDVPRFGGFCYIYVSEPELLAAEAEAACQLDFTNGHLASVHSLEEDDYISQLVDPDAVGGITAHIGGVAPNGFCDGPDAPYDWTDESPWDFQNWRASEPNCSSQPIGAIQFWPNTNGTLSGWNDVRAHLFTRGYVCKFGGP